MRCVDQNPRVRPTASQLVEAVKAIDANLAASTSASFDYVIPHGMVATAMTTPVPFETHNSCKASEIPTGSVFGSLSQLRPGSIEDVLRNLKLEKYIDKFLEEEVDLDAAKLLSIEDFQSKLGMKTGPAVKLHAFFR